MTRQLAMQVLDFVATRLGLLPAGHVPRLRLWRGSLSEEEMGISSSETL